MLKQLKRLYYEMIVDRFVCSFMLYLYNEGYQQEANEIADAVISYSNKELQRLKTERKYHDKHICTDFYS